MSDDVIIQLEDLGKKYSLQHRGDQRYVALRDVLTEKASAFFKKLKSGNGQNHLTSDLRPPASDPSVSRTSKEDFWALKGITFEVRRGEVLGIIGRNGAGKTTLLKILSRITEPTEGRVRIRGRVASLLEVGTGFHPELTGRENIYLNGAILGMTKAEIKKKFDEIVAFAETEKFLDTPVKRYSSGMYVRLAFAVAAHLEPEILVVDEVLAVGDAEFQKKCLGKMESVATREGRTVLFVSHNMAAVKSLTQHAIVLDHGSKVFEGASTDAIGFYSKLAQESSSRVGERFRGCGRHTKLFSARLVEKDGKATTEYRPGNPLIIEIEFETDGAAGMSVDGFLLDESRTKLAYLSPYQFGGQKLPAAPGKYICKLELAPLHLASGSYSFDLATAVINSNWDHYVENAVEFSIVYCNPGGLSWDFKQGYGYGDVALVPISIKLEQKEHGPRTFLSPESTSVSAV